MSELTKCNYCTLQRMRETAKERGATVIIAKDVMNGNTWTTARYSDRDKPSAHFLQLPDHCVC